MARKYINSTNKTPKQAQNNIQGLNFIANSVSANVDNIKELINIINKKAEENNIENIVNTDSNKFSEMVYVTENMLTAVAGFLTDNKNIDFKKPYRSLLTKTLSDVLKSSSNIKESDSVSDYVNGTSSNYNFYVELEGIDEKNLQSMVDALNSIYDISPVSNKSFGNIATLLSAVTLLLDINKSLSKNLPLLVVGELASESLQTVVGNLNTLVSGGKGSKGLKQLMKSIDDAESKGVDIKFMAAFFTDLSLLMKNMAKSAVWATFVNDKSGKKLVKAVDTLNDIIVGLKGMQIKEIEVNAENLTKFSNLVTSMKSIFTSLSVIGLLALPAILGAKAFNMISKGIIGGTKVILDLKVKKDDIEKVNKLTSIVKSMLFVIGIASLMSLLIVPNAVNLLLFTGLLTLFIGATVGITMLLSKIKVADNAMQCLDSISKLLIKATIAMAIGALFVRMGFEEDLAIYSGILVGFVMVVSFVAALAQKIAGKNGLEGIYAISSFVIKATIAMSIGAIFVKLGYAHSIMIFGGILLAFISLVTLAVGGISSLFNKKGKNGPVQIMDEFKKLILTATVALIVGALFIQYFGATNILIFASILAGFIVIIGTVIGVFGKSLSKAKGAIYGLALIVVVAATALIIGTMFIEEYGWKNAVIFAGVAVGMVGAFAFILYLLGKIPKANLLIGLAAMGAIVIVSLLMSVVVGNLADAFEKFGDIGNAFLMVGVVAAIVVAIGGLIFGLGALICTGVGGLIFLAGVAGLTAIVALTYFLSEALLNIGNAFKTLAEASQLNISTESIDKLLDSYVGICFKLSEVTSKIPMGKIKLVADSMGSVGTMVSSMAAGVQAIAELRIPTAWDKNGNPISFREMIDTDFDKAGKNITKITGTLAGALIGIYKFGIGEEKDIFKKPIRKGIFGNERQDTSGLSPIECVIASVGAMGGMVSQMASGIKDFVELRMPVYDSNGNITGYRAMKSGDFTAAAKNIGTIATTIGDALITVYEKGIDKNKDIFKKPYKVGLFSGIKQDTSALSPIECVIASVGGMVNLISLMAKAVKDVVDMNFYIEDEKGKKTPVNIPLTDLNPGGKVQQNIEKIVTCVANSITAIYNKHKNTLFNKRWEVYKRFDGDKLLGIINATSNIIDTVKKSIKDISDGDKPIDKWKNIIEGIINPFQTSNLNYTSLDNMTKFSNLDFGKTKSLITSINSIDTAKTDKFLELLEGMNKLSVSMDDMNEFVNGLNGRISNTLYELSQKVDKAADAIEKSEKAQDKRQEIIKENAKLIKEALDSPMKLDGGSTPKPVYTIPYNNVQNDNGSNNTPNGLPNFLGSSGSKNDKTMINMASTLSEILELFKIMVQKNK